MIIWIELMNDSIIKQINKLRYKTVNPVENHLNPQLMKCLLFLLSLILSVYTTPNLYHPKTPGIGLKAINYSESISRNQVRTLQTEGNTTTNAQYVPQIECEKQCSTLEYYVCSVCYDMCTTKTSTSTTVSFAMSTCTHTKCKKYKFQSQTKTTECSEWQTQNLSEAECTQTCCNSPSYNQFTIENWYSCVDVNTSKSDTNNLISLILGTVLGGALVIVILIIIICCCKDRISVACQNSSWCCQSFFTGKYVTKAMKQKSSSTKDTTTPQANQSKTQNVHSAHHLNRTHPKWTQINMKKQAPSLTSSKYIIQSQYDINPQIYCSICLDDMINCKTACSHNFHFQCLRTSLKKTFKCPQCDTKNINPLKIICDECRQKQTIYSIDKKNMNIKRPNFYHQNKITCDNCLHEKLGSGSRERI